ncbi:MAG: sulfite exporter TauE/SafE family protein [Hyphomonadaceae bacterium]
MDSDLAIFALVGFLAQLVDGALGMAYGLISSSILLSLGVPPATASACVHAAEVFTTGASATSHILHRNVNGRMLVLLSLAGACGGAFGAFVLTSADGAAVKPFVSAYLGFMGVFILWRAARGRREAKPLNPRWAPPLGVVGGTMDAIGGGGWGPAVTSTLLGAGGTPREVIGTVNTAEFFVSAAISSAFIVALVTGNWKAAGDLTDHAWQVGGLVLGGVVAAPLAGYATRLAPPRILTFLVGGLIVALSLFQLSALL